VVVVVGLVELDAPIEPELLLPAVPEPLVPELLGLVPALLPEELLGDDDEPEPPMVVEPPAEPEAPAVLGVLLLPDEPEVPAVLGLVPLLPPAVLLEEPPGCAPAPAVPLVSWPQAASDIAAATMTARAEPRESWEAFIWELLGWCRKRRNGSPFAA
jgi:hypothetical protein